MFRDGTSHSQMAYLSDSQMAHLTVLPSRLVQADGTSSEMAHVQSDGTSHSQTAHLSDSQMAHLTVLPCRLVQSDGTSSETAHLTVSQTAHVSDSQMAHLQSDGTTAGEHISLPLSHTFSRPPPHLPLSLCLSLTHTHQLPKRGEGKAIRRNIKE